MRNLQPLRKGRQVISLEEALAGHQPKIEPENLEAKGTALVIGVHVKELGKKYTTIAEVQPETKKTRVIRRIDGHVSCMTFYGGTIMCAIGPKVFDYRYDGPILWEDNEILSMCTIDDKIWTATKEVALCRKDLSYHDSINPKSPIKLMCADGHHILLQLEDSKIIGSDDRSLVRKGLYEATAICTHDEKIYLANGEEGGAIYEATEGLIRIRDCKTLGMISYEGELYDYSKTGLRKTFTNERIIDNAIVAAACSVPREYIDEILRK